MKTESIMKVLSSLVAVAFAQGALALPSVSVDSVIQRWPWNNKVDITYTIGDGLDLANGSYYRLVFTATINGTTYAIDGSHDVIAKASTGTHTVTWDAPSGLKATGCTMVASLYETTGDYMIIDLGTGAYAFEDMRETQALSNARYNTDLCKTDRMVLRRVARTANSAYPSGYQTGHSNYGAGSNQTYKNSPKLWTTSKDYFIGIFEVTQAQYVKLGFDNPSEYKTDDPSHAENRGDRVPLRPVDKVSYYTLRFARRPSAAFGSSNVESWSFFVRLIGKTGLSGFDLPTEVMWEIAARAGTSTLYYWGDAAASIYTYATIENWGYTFPVGSHSPNGWGIYDMSGNSREFVRDDNSLSDLANAVDPFTPADNGSSENLIMRGGCIDNTSGTAELSPANRPSNSGWTIYLSSSRNSFRVSLVAP